MNGYSPVTAFTQKLEERVNETKKDEEKRREYMLLKSFEMDARRAGIQEGIAQGFADGSYQTKLETAKNLLAMNFPIENIVKATGLSIQEVKEL